MHQPCLVIMAAGMGSRFGGPKQTTPVDEYGHFLLHYSLFDAYRAGFRKVVFVVKEETAEEFRESVGPHEAVGHRSRRAVRRARDRRAVCRHQFRRLLRHRGLPPAV